MNAPKNLITVDCRGMQCPAPILQIARTAREYRSESVVLEVMADDKDFPTDVRAWCRTARANLIQEDEQQGTFRVWLGLNGAQQIPTGFGEPPPAAAPAPAAAAPAPAPVPTPAALAPAAPVVGSSAAPTRLDLRGQPVSAALLTLSSAVLAAPRSALEVTADSGDFIGSVYSWAQATRSTLADLRVDGAAVTFTVRGDASLPDRPAAAPTPAAPAAVVPEASQLPALMMGGQQENRCSLLILHNDFEALMAALMVANAAAAQQMEVEVYFSFWGINLLRADNPGQGEARPPFLQRMMAWMMPAGPKRQSLGKMNFGGMGTGMMTHIMRKNNVLSLEQLMDAAAEQGVRFVGCTMSMGLMGIRKCDLVQRENLVYGGVTSFVEVAQRSKIALVF